MRYFKTTLITCFITCGYFLSSLMATGDSISVLTHRDTIFIHNDSIIGKYFVHKVEPKQTLYSICRFYGLTQESMQEINPALKIRQLQIGDDIRIPLSEKVIRIAEVPKDALSFAPVFYQVQQGEGLYRIAKNYFNIKMDKLMAINHLTSTDIHVDQLLLIGWVPLKVFSGNKNSVPKTTSTTENKNTEKDVKREEKDKGEMSEAVNTAVENAKSEEAAAAAPSGNKSKFEEQGKKLKKQSGQGAAFWHKELAGTTGLYVLHRTAAINSVIAITNPMFNTTIYAKVVGTISSKSYTDDIVLVVSPEVAKQLGAKDARFFCRFNYYIK